MKCPECDRPLRASAKNCTCGWSKGKGAKEAKCNLCANVYPFPSRAGDVPFGRPRIVGRTRAGGHICAACYERGESFDYRDKAFADFYEKHKDDEWGGLIRTSREMKGASREDCHDFMQSLIALARKGGGGAFGKLPYDPSVRERRDYEPGMMG